MSCGVAIVEAKNTAVSYRNVGQGFIWCTIKRFRLFLSIRVFFRHLCIDETATTVDALPTVRIRFCDRPAVPLRDFLEIPGIPCLERGSSRQPTKITLEGTRSQSHGKTGTKKGCNTRTSQEVTHPCTTLAQARLTSEF